MDMDMVKLLDGLEEAIKKTAKKTRIELLRSSELRNKGERFLDVFSYIAADDDDWENDYKKWMPKEIQKLYNMTSKSRRKELDKVTDKQWQSVIDFGETLPTQYFR